MSEESEKNISELEKMEAGLWYDANNDEKLYLARLETESLCFELNQTNPKETEKRREILMKIFPNAKSGCVILSPVMADYGKNVFIGEKTFINHGAYLMDCAKITIGKHCFIGPDCAFYTAVHPLLSDERNLGLEKALPITIGDNVWLGGKVVVLPGVKIGSCSVVGAGSVVAKDVPPGVVAAGNPCRVLRKITEADRITKKDGNA